MISGPLSFSLSILNAMPSSSIESCFPDTLLAASQKSLNLSSSFHALSPCGRLEKSKVVALLQLAKAGFGSHLSPAVGSQSEKVWARAMLVRAPRARARVGVCIFAVFFPGFVGR